MAFKICPNCQEKNPARIRRCKKCDSAFAFKVKKQSKKSGAITVSDWKGLLPGEYIKVSGGSVWLDKDGTELSMGYSGIFTVVGIDKNGILACGKDKTSGFCHIWMGDEVMNPAGILKRPHRVAKINIR
jgi:ribosomal protein L40E